MIDVVLKGHDLASFNLDLLLEYPIDAINPDLFLFELLVFLDELMHLLLETGKLFVALVKEQFKGVVLGCFLSKLHLEIFRFEQLLIHKSLQF